MAEPRKAKPKVKQSLGSMDMRWVLQHLEDDPAPDKFPRASTKALFLWVKQKQPNRDAFMKRILDKGLGDAEADEESDDTGPVLKLVEDLIVRFQADQAKRGVKS